MGEARDKFREAVRDEGGVPPDVPGDDGWGGDGDGDGGDQGEGVSVCLPPSATALLRAAGLLCCAGVLFLCCAAVACIALAARLVAGLGGVP